MHLASHDWRCITNIKFVSWTGTPRFFTSSPLSLFSLSPCHSLCLCVWVCSCMLSCEGSWRVRANCCTYNFLLLYRVGGNALVPVQKLGGSSFKILSFHETDVKPNTERRTGPSWLVFFWTLWGGGSLSRVFLQAIPYQIMSWGYFSLLNGLLWGSWYVDSDGGLIGVFQSFSELVQYNLLVPKSARVPGEVYAKVAIVSLLWLNSMLFSSQVSIGTLVCRWRVSSPSSGSTHVFFSFMDRQLMWGVEQNPKTPNSQVEMANECVYANWGVGQLLM